MNESGTNVLNLHPGLVVGFAVIVLLMMLLDLGVFNKKSHVISSKEALGWSTLWISLAMLFSGAIYWLYNKDAGGHQVAVNKIAEFQAAYWVEQALSVDNLFVFILIFNFFKVPKHLQHKVLFWGIIGAIVFRAIFIFAGVGLIKLSYIQNSVGLLGNHEPFNIILIAFGLFLAVAGIRSWGKHKKEESQDFGNSFAVRIIKKLFKVSDTYDGDKFFTFKNGKKMATPLLLVLAVIEFSDLLFAVDSIPAIFAISKDPFILYTSNIFAILGLRSLYFLLANFINMFSKLPYGLSIILTFIGVKMLIAPWIEISSVLSLIVVGGLLILSVILSLIFPEKKVP
ncbi:MAG TPA: TerC/Alx family metal homeostasis membrane protein [Edaphocola sp.]|nr:TerC/Alx family metal homeostasis membrane protein [Edaphocola sp.]